MDETDKVPTTVPSSVKKNCEAYDAGDTAGSGEFGPVCPGIPRFHAGGGLDHATARILCQMSDKILP